MINGRIYLFGSLQLIPGEAEDGPPLEIRSAKLQTLLAYLSLHLNRPLDRDKVGRALWPDARQSSARRNLREYLYRARQILEAFIPDASMLEAEENSITFSPPPTCWIDLTAFERLSDEGRRLATTAPAEAIARLEQAGDLYKGHLLSNLYDDWVIAERERLRELFIDNLARLGQLLQVSNRLNEAIAVTQRLLEYDPLREREHRRLMELYLASGARAGALQQYQRCRQILAEELAAEPMPETQALHRAILAQEEAVRPVEATLSSPASIQSPSLFVGRQAELARLTLALTQSRAGQTKIAIVTGDSGLGKTRLVNEWLASQPHDTTILRGQSHEFEQDIPYRPVLDALQQSLHLMPWENLPPDSTFTWLAPVAQLLPDLYYHLPELPPPGSQTDSDTGHHAGEGLSQLLLAFARRAPLILFLDDLHWADRPTWRFLSFLARRAQRVPLFIVGTFCTSEAQREQLAHLRGLEQSGTARQVPLSRLWPADIARLVSHMLDQPVQQLNPLVQRLHQETEGNPFYVIEMVNALVESRLSPPYRPEHLNKLPLPSVVQAVIENRLDRLNPDSKQALCTAAAIGREFGFYLLAAVTQVDEDQLLDYLDEWLARGLLVEQRPGRYDFSHTRVREGAYHSLSRPRRQRIHYRIARALETAHPGDVERVAYHDNLSDQPDRAIPNLLESGRRALNLRSYQEARKFGRTLLELLAQLPPTGASKDRLDRQMQLAQAYCFTGDIDQALPILEESAQTAETLADTSRISDITLRIARLYWLRGDAPQARHYAERTQGLLGQRAAPAQQAAVLRLLGRINVAQGNFETAAEQLGQSLLLESGPESQLARGAASGYLAIALAHIGDRAGAIAALEEAQQIARRLESLTALAVARVWGAVVYAALEMWAQAQELAAIGLSDCEAQDLPAYAFVARSVLGRVAHFKGDDATAYQRLQEAIAWAEANQYTLFRHMPHLYLAEAALARGDTDTGREQAQIALDLARRTGNRWTEERVLAYLHLLET